MEAMERARQKQQVNIFEFGDHLSILIIKYEFVPDDFFVFE